MAKCYKELAFCKLCKQRFVVETDSDVYNSKFMAKTYCKACYKKYIETQEERDD